MHVKIHANIPSKSPGEVLPLNDDVLFIFSGWLSEDCWLDRTKLDATAMPSKAPEKKCLNSVMLGVGNSIYTWLQQRNWRYTGTETGQIFSHNYKDFLKSCLPCFKCDSC